VIFRATSGTGGRPSGGPPFHLMHDYRWGGRVDTRSLPHHALLAVAVLIAAFVLCGAGTAFAAECTLCHTAGGVAPDGSAHPVPPPPLWDITDGTCTICHEIENSLFYQLPPHGAYPIDGYAVDEDDYAYPHGEIWLYGIPCAGCHNGTQLIHGRPFTANWASAGPINLVGSDCAGCHTSGMAYPTDALAPAYTAQIDPATHGDLSVHEGGLASYTGCESCHNDNISTEHDDDCNACHQSTDPLVVAAIDEGNVSCTSCHPEFHGGSHDSPIIGTYCENCHSGSLLGEPAHVECETCHSSEDPLVVSAIAAGDTSCYSCHPAAHTSPHGGYTTTTNKCAVCHSTHYAEGSFMLLRANSREAACDYCHGSGGGSSLIIQMDNAYKTNDGSGTMYLDGVADIANTPEGGYGTGHTLGYTGMSPADVKPAFQSSSGFSASTATARTATRHASWASWPTRAGRSERTTSLSRRGSHVSSAT
jgi:hypothetical protein